MSVLNTAIPFTKISKIKIYVNSNRKTMAQIKRDLGCDYLINAGLYNMTTFKPMNMLVSDGDTLANSKGKYGMSFCDGSITLTYENNTLSPEHVSGYPCLLKDGQKAFSATPSGLGGKRGRSAIGYGTHAIVLYCCSDGNDALYLDDLRSKMKSLGCINAINLDGGGSSQCDFNGKQIRSSRIVHNYIAIWLKHDGTVKIVSTKSKPLNIREGAPNAFGINNSKVIGTYSKGEYVTVYETRSGWCRTNRGWVSGIYLK